MFNGFGTNHKMTFADILNNYINRISCSMKDLAIACDLSPSVISRYKSGEREPNINGEQIKKLAFGIHSLLNDIEDNKESAEDILESLKNALNKKNIDFEIFSGKFDLIIKTLNINVNDLASHMNFDSSHIYRIRQGSRKPNDLVGFSNNFCDYVAVHLANTKKLDLLFQIIPDINKNTTNDELKDYIQKWLLDGSKDINESSKSSSISNFLDKLNDFDLGEYIKAIHFDELKVPTIPFFKPLSKNYYGVTQMRTGEIDFFKSTALSKSNEPIFMHSDMPMIEMSKDMDFNKKWMFGIAANLKKGLTLNIIHNLDRPFDELMLGLEAWIPIYMTGQVNPFYLPDSSSKNYHHLTYVSGVCALRGECVHGDNGSGKYYLTSNKKEIAYYRRFSNSLLKNAKPLMEIYTGNKVNDFKTKYRDQLKNKNENPNFSKVFNHIKLYFLEDNGIIIEKEKAPKIYFVIRHPLMVDAINHFKPPIS